jgi:hypothetical protein
MAALPLSQPGVSDQVRPLLGSSIFSVLCEAVFGGIQAHGAIRQASPQLNSP